LGQISPFKLVSKEVSLEEFKKLDEKRFFGEGGELAGFYLVAIFEHIALQMKHDGKS
jgi:hypothetical protein